MTRVNNKLLNGLEKTRGEPIAGHVRNARINANEGLPDILKVNIDWVRAAEVAEAADAAKAEKASTRKANARLAAGRRPRKARAWARS